MFNLVFMLYEHGMKNKTASIRLFVNEPLAEGLSLALADKQAHYLLHVMRCGDGAMVKIFNGRDGEWLAVVRRSGKRDALLDVVEKLREQSSVTDCGLYFAPIKSGALEFLIQKATELGVSYLQPVITQRTVVARVNLERLTANAVEAAEQSERLCVPAVREPIALPFLVPKFDRDRTLIFCDESGAGESLVRVLANAKPNKFALLTGPEGGFTEPERKLIASMPQSVAVGLGPRIMKADTAAVAALACVQSVWGDWNE